MDHKRHAWLARELINACGGLEASAGCCRLARSRLAEFCDPSGSHFMPADVIHDLEAYCGEPHYSRALFEARPSAAYAISLLAEACETVEEAAAIQRLVRVGLAKDGRLSAADKVELRKLTTQLDQQIRELLAAGDGEGEGT